MKALKLSKRARETLVSMHRGYRYFYHPGYMDHHPKAIQELMDAGLVTIGERALTTQLCYVPVGFQCRQEIIPPLLEEGAYDYSI